MADAHHEKSLIAQARAELAQRLPRTHRAWWQLRDAPTYLRQTSREGELERVREHIAGLEERQLLRRERGLRDVCWPEGADRSQPLVSVRIATYRRGPAIKRTLDSVLCQTYGNLDVLVVGDACDDATVSAVESYADPRLRFINLPTRGLYPEDAISRWMVAGTHPMNAALPLLKGHWIAPCDDDDTFTPTHVERLLDSAISQRLEMVWSRARLLQEDGSWLVTDGPPLALGSISHGSVLYSAGLRFFQHSNTAWKVKEPGDWNLWRRMSRAGVRIGFLDEVTYHHH